MIDTAANQLAKRIRRPRIDYGLYGLYACACAHNANCTSTCCAQRPQAARRASSASSTHHRSGINRRGHRSERALSAASLRYSPCAAAAACPRHQALPRQRCSDGSARLSPRVGHLHSKQLCVSTTAEALAPPRAVSDRGAPTGDNAAVRLLPWRSSVSTRALRALSALERQQAASFCPARALAAPGVPEKSMHNLNAAAFARRLKKRRPGFAIRAALKPLWNLGSDLG